MTHEQVTLGTRRPGAVEDEFCENRPSLVGAEQTDRYPFSCSRDRQCGLTSLPLVPPLRVRTGEIGSKAATGVKWYQISRPTMPEVKQARKKGCSWPNDGRFAVTNACVCRL